MRNPNLLTEIATSSSTGERRRGGDEAEPRAKASVPAYRSFPTDALPEPIRGFVVAGAKIGGLEGLVVGWTIAVSIEGVCVCLIWVFAANLGISTNLSHKFAAAPPLQI